MDITIRSLKKVKIRTILTLILKKSFGSIKWKDIIH